MDLEPRYQLADAAKAVGVHKNTILLWEAQGKIPHADRDHHGWRSYTAAELDEIRRCAAANREQAVPVRIRRGVQRTGPREVTPPTDLSAPIEEAVPSAESHETSSTTLAPTPSSPIVAAPTLPESPSAQTDELPLGSASPTRVATSDELPPAVADVPRHHVILHPSDLIIEQSAPRRLSAHKHLRSRVLVPALLGPLLLFVGASALIGNKSITVTIPAVSVSLPTRDDLSSLVSSAEVAVTDAASELGAVVGSSLASLGGWFLDGTMAASNFIRHGTSALPDRADLAALFLSQRDWLTRLFVVGSSEEVHVEIPALPTTISLEPSREAGREKSDEPIRGVQQDPVRRVSEDAVARAAVETLAASFRVYGARIEDIAADLAVLKAQPAVATVTYASPVIQSITREIALTQRINNLDDLTISNGLTISSGGLTVSSGSLTAGSLSVTGITNTGSATIGGTLTVSGTGTSTFAGPVDITGAFTANNGLFTISATSTSANQFSITRIPNTAHTFASWATGVANSAVSDASIYINPASAVADTNLLGVAVSGSPKFIVDAEGDVFVKSLTSEGSVTSGSTTASSLLVENTLYAGDAVTDSFFVNAGTVGYSNRSTTTIQNLTVNAFSIATSTTASSPLLSFSTASSPFGFVGIGTSSPATTLSVAGHGYLTGGLGIGRATTTSGVLETSGAAAIGGSLSVTGNAAFSGSATTTFGAGLSLSGGNFNVATNGAYLINNARIVDATSLGSSVLSSSLTSLGTLSSVNVSGLATLSGGILASGASTIPNLTITLATSTQATTTYLSVTTHASTSQLTVSGASTFAGIATLNSPVIQGIVSAGTGLTLPTFTLGGAITGSSQAITGLSQVTVTGTTATSTFSTGGFTIGTSQFVVQQGSGNIGIGTTSPYARLSVTGEVVSQMFTATSSTATSSFLGIFSVGSTTPAATALFSVGTSSPLLHIDRFSGNIGLGTSNPGRHLDVLNANSAAQLRISQSTSNYAELTTDSLGDIRISATGGDVRLLDENLWVCAGGACPAGTTVAGTGNLVVENYIGIGTSSPSFAISAAGDIYLTGSIRFSDGTTQSSAAAPAPTGFTGLHLRTHPDNDLRKTTVSLVHADEIQLDNGTKVSDWNNITAAITSSGAGGLDTGSEAASTWYEIYAIYNGSTKSALLHRAKNFALDQSQTTNNGEQNLRDSVNGTRIAQSFQAGITGKLEMIDVSLQAPSPPTGNFWFQLEADSGGSPSGTALTTTDKLDAVRLSTSDYWVRMVFRSPATITSGTTYWLVMYGDFAISAASYARWNGNTAGGYANGTAASFNGSVWSNQSMDHDFKTYVTQNDTGVTMPSGYTGKAKIGYVYNDSGSDFDPFAAHDRHIASLEGNQQLFSNATAAIATLSDGSVVIPPVPVKLWVAIGGVGVWRVAMGGVPDGYAGTDSTRGAGNLRISGADAKVVLGGFVHTTYQGVYGALVTGTSYDVFVDSFEW